MIAHEGEVVLRKVPSVVHGRSQEAVGADYIKQGADHSLARAWGLTGSTIRRLKVLDDGSAVANHFALCCDQSGNGRQFAFREHLRLETLVPCRALLKGDVVFYEITASTPRVERVRHGVEDVRLVHARVFASCDRPPKMATGRAT